MGKNKGDNTMVEGKKRKADVNDVVETNTKKPRREQASAFVHLPHSPGGTVPLPTNAIPRTKLDQGSKATNGAIPAEDVSTTANAKTTKAGRKRQRAREKKLVEDEAALQSQLEALEPAETPFKDITVLESATAASAAAELGSARKKQKKKKSGSEPEQKLQQQLQKPTSDVTGSSAQLKGSSKPTGDGVEEDMHSSQTEVAMAKQVRRELKKARRAAAKAEKATDNSNPSPAVKSTLDKSKRPSSKTPREAEVIRADKKQLQTDWSLSESAAGRFIGHDPVFVRDSKTGEEFLIAAKDREVQLLSIDTSLVVRSTSTPAGQTVQCFAADGANGDKVHIACSDGSLVTWDWRQGSLSGYTQALKGTAKALAWSTSSQETDGALFYLGNTGKNTFISYKGQSLFTTTQHMHSLQVIGNTEYIVAYGPSGFVLGMRKDKKNADSDFIWVEMPVDIAVTCVDARLNTDGQESAKRRSPLSLVVGNVEGQLHMYDDITSIFAQKGQASLPAPRILHWHREAVSALKFSQDGNYIISGGKETVLVLWQLETGKKQFLPHLTSEIERLVVSPTGDRYAVQMGDNSIMVLSTSELKPIANFAGLQQAHPVRLGARKKASDEAHLQKKVLAAVLHPKHANQLLLTVPATQPKTREEAAEARPFLQTFDLRTSQHITRQALTRNNVTDFNLGPEKTPIAAPDVSKLAISRDGQWLATVDEWAPPASDLTYVVRNNEQSDEQRCKRREVHLKIWQWDAPHEIWTLSTRVDSPHARGGNGTQGAGKIFALVGDPVATGFATLGENGSVKIWKPKPRMRSGVVMKAAGDADLVEWTCRRTIELPLQAQRADSPLDDVDTWHGGPSEACLAYSEDGSVLAAFLSSSASGEQPLIHFLDPLSGTIKATKSDVLPPCPEALAFLDRYLIAVSQGSVHVWDLVTEKSHQRYTTPIPKHKTHTPILAVNPTDGTFAVAVGSRVAVYKPSQSVALYKTSCGSTIVAVLAGKSGKGFTLLMEDATVRTLHFVGAASQRGLLYVATQASPPAQSANEVDVVDDVEMTDLLALPAADASGEVEMPDLQFEEAEDDRPVVRPEQLAQVFDVGQSFAMPPVKEMFDAVAGLFGRRPLVGQMAA